MLTKLKEWHQELLPEQAAMTAHQGRLKKMVAQEGILTPEAADAFAADIDGMEKRIEERMQKADSISEAVHSVLVLATIVTFGWGVTAVAKHYQGEPASLDGIYLFILCSVATFFVAKINNRFNYWAQKQYRIESRENYPVLCSTVERAAEHKLLSDVEITRLEGRKFIYKYEENLLDDRVQPVLKKEEEAKLEVKRLAILTAARETAAGS